MLKKIKNFIFQLIYIFLITYLVVFIPVFWGHKPLVIISGSMSPTLQIGGILYYHEYDVKNFKKGDILVYKTKDHIISHRVVEKTQDGYVTKGDYNKSNDSNIVNFNQILGKGTNWCIPYIGYYADFIYNHKYILYTFLFMIIIDAIYDNAKKKKDINDEKN